MDAVAAAGPGVAAEVPGGVREQSRGTHTIQVIRSFVLLPRKRHVPERTCVACGDKKPKAELYRVARSADGQVSVDYTGKAPGRGAYVCGPGCWETALGKGRLARSLGSRLSGNDLKTLREEALQA